jgi:ATP-binding cassette subfamily B protein
MKGSLKQYRTLLITYLNPLRGRVALLALLLLGGIGLQLWAPQILRNFIDLAQTGLEQGQVVIEDLTRLAGLFLAVTLLGQVVRLGASYVTQDVRWRTTNHIRGDLTAHCLALDMSFHNAQTPGKMIERIDGDVNELSNFFSQFVVQVLGNAVLLVGVLALLFREDWRIGLCFLIFTGVMFVILGRVVNVAAPLWKDRRQASSELFGFLEERLAGTEDIRANGGVPYVMRGLQQAVRELFLKTRKALFIGVGFGWGTTEAMFAVGTILALGLGGYLMLRGSITIGAVYLVFHYNTMLQWPLNQLSRQLRELQSASASIERIQELFGMRPQVRDVPRTQADALPAGPLAVQFDGVDFGYEDDGLVLKDLCWQLQSGEALGVLGRTGSGKTTMTRLLCRLYDPTQGRVRLGDVPLDNTCLADLRRRVGVVTQEVQLFQASVRDNLTFFDDAIDDDAIRSVIYSLGLERWYEGLPEGLDSKLSASSGGLSAGEAQLLAFTRVFLRDPGLVILDEASSRLDPFTEQLIERAIDRLLCDRTAVIVAHRLATVQRADKIMILEDGRIVEFGERATLVADPDSRFARLLQTGMEEVLV